MPWENNALPKPTAPPLGAGTGTGWVLSPPRRRLEPTSATPGRYRGFSSGQRCSQAAELRGVSRLARLIGERMA